MRKYKLKELRELVRLGVAEDYTNKPSEYIYTLRRLEKVGYSTGVYGINGGLVEDAETGQEFIYSGEKSCKVLYTPERVTKAAADFVGAIKLIATKPDNLDNLESYLSHHFPEWVSRWANSPEDLAAEMKEFARMEI